MAKLPCILRWKARERGLISVSFPYLEGQVLGSEHSTYPLINLPGLGREGGGGRASLSPSIIILLACYGWGLFWTYWNACNITWPWSRHRLTCYMHCPWTSQAFLEFTLLGILERGDMDSLSQLELKDNVRPVFESPDNLNISFVRHMICTNTFAERFVSFSYVPLSFCPVLVRFLFGGVCSLAVNWPVLVRYLCDHCAFYPLHTPFVRASTSNGDDVHHRIIFFPNVYIRWTSFLTLSGKAPVTLCRLTIPSASV